MNQKFKRSKIWKWLICIIRTLRNYRRNTGKILWKRLTMKQQLNVMTKTGEEHYKKIDNDIKNKMPPWLIKC